MEQSQENKKIFLESVQKMWQLEQWQLSCIACCPPGRLVPIGGEMEYGLHFYFWKVYVTLHQLNLCKKKKREEIPPFQGLQPNSMSFPVFKLEELTLTH